MKTEMKYPYGFIQRWWSLNVSKQLPRILDFWNPRIVEPKSLFLGWNVMY